MEMSYAGSLHLSSRLLKLTRLRRASWVIGSAKQHLIGVVVAVENEGPQALFCPVRRGRDTLHNCLQDVFDANALKADGQHLLSVAL